MPSATIQRINGLLLGRTPTQTGETHVVKGRNFMPFLEGPRSYFGATPLNNSPFTHNARYPAVFPNDGNFVYIDETGVYGINDECNTIKLFEFECKECARESCDFDYPWTTAYVGDSHFYSHPSVGLIEYDTFKKEWCQHSRKALGFSDLIFGITASNGSLIVLSRDTVTWSAFDDGTKLIENEYSGVGSQSLHLAKHGRPLGVFSDGQGWFTFTTHGIMYSRPLSSSQIISGENVEGSTVFRHDTFKSDSIPFSPFSIINVSEGLIVYLGNKGLTQIGRFENNQFTSKTYAPEMSRWMREKLFTCGDTDELSWASHRLFYDKSKGYLFVSFSYKNNREYNEALVYDKELQEWGSFNRRHTLIVNVPFNGHSHQQSRLGYLTRNGYVSVFSENVNHVVNDYGALKTAPVDSFIDVGYFRQENELDTDRMYSLEGFTIETHKCHTDFNVNVFGANGECDYDKECTPTDPYLHSSRNCANYYVCSNLGTVHILRISAERLNQSFWLKLIRLNTKQRGKI